MKILQIIAFAFAFSFFGVKAKSQCIEVEELYAIGGGIESKSFWDNINLKKSALDDLEDGLSNMSKGVSFLTPLIVNHIRFFHPKCNIRKDKDEFKRIVKVYNYLHDKNYSSDSLDIENTCNNVITDFKEYCRNDTTFGKILVFMFESGPYFGEKVSKLPTQFSITDSIDIGIGKVFSLADSDGAYFAYSTQTNDYEWVIKTTVCTFSPNTFSKFSKNSLGFIVKLGLGGYATRLYLDTKGRFRFYICELD
jgi:hypothetical protein